MTYDEPSKQLFFKQVLNLNSNVTEQNIKLETVSNALLVDLSYFTKVQS